MGLDTKGLTFVDAYEKATGSNAPFVMMYRDHHSLVVDLEPL